MLKLKESRHKSRFGTTWSFSNRPIKLDDTDAKDEASRAKLHEILGVSDLEDAVIYFDASGGWSEKTHDSPADSSVDIDEVKAEVTRDEQTTVVKLDQSLFNDETFTNELIRIDDSESE